MAGAGALAEFIAFEIAGPAVPFARAGSNGSRRYTPQKQANFMAIVKDKAMRAMGARGPLTGPVELSVRVTDIVPQSWSRARREGAQWITKRPDADNLAKILADAMNKIVYVDDAQVASLIVQKRYGEFCRVTVSVIDLEGAA